MTQAELKTTAITRQSIDTYNPATEEVYKTYYLHTKQEAEALIEASHQAFQSWRKTSLEERATIIKKIAELLRRDKADLAQMIAKQMGKPLALGEGEAEQCAAICEYTAEHGIDALADEEREISTGKKGIITYQPEGVILGMQPWNFPLYQCIRYSIAVIMAGNTTVFKHDESCFETAEAIQKIYEEAGLPKGVFCCLFVDGETADELIAHPHIRGVTFTGSARIGRLIAKISGEHLKKNVLELGGSDAYIVLRDADIDLAVKTCVQGRVMNSGQTCIAAKRFIIEAPVYEEFREKYVAAMKQLTFGDPTNSDHDMGPLARVDLRDKLHQQVQESVMKGATCLCGGEVPDQKGAYYPATVLENIQAGSPAYDDELFGPVAALFKVADEAEAIALANDHRYGLGGGIFSKDEERAIRIAREELDTGMVNINGYAGPQANMPFGGVKESGYGREHGGFGIKEFVNAKSLFVA